MKKFYAALLGTLILSPFPASAGPDWEVIQEARHAHAMRATCHARKPPVDKSASVKEGRKRAG